MDNFYIISILGSALIMAFAFFIERKTGSSGYIDSIGDYKENQNSLLSDYIETDAIKAFLYISGISSAFQFHLL